MSLLRIMLVIAYAHENNFPWPLWLYAIVLEFNYLAECHAQFRFFSGKPILEKEVTKQA